jgi:hypothetical protein
MVQDKTYDKHHIDTLENHKEDLARRKPDIGISHTARQRDEDQKESEINHGIPYQRKPRKNNRNSLIHKLDLKTTISG